MVYGKVKLKCIDPKNKRCGTVDKLFRIAVVSVERGVGGSGACQGAPYKER